jgi:hypothetical protein
MGGVRNAYENLVAKPRKRPLGRPRRRWKYNIKMNFKEAGCEGVD